MTNFFANYRNGGGISTYTYSGGVYRNSDGNIERSYQNGESIYEISFNGNTSYVYNKGELGQVSILSNGALSFSNFNGGMTSLGLWEHGNSAGQFRGNPAGGGANAWYYISNGASVASGYPTISGTWAYNTSGDVAWTGKNGNYYKLSQVKNNGGYVKSMNYAKNASRLTRGLGNGLTGLSIVTSIGSVGVNLYNGTDNTSVWVGAAIGIGTGILTFVAAPVVVTGAAIVGTAWGVGQLVAGDEINGWIDNNFGYR